MDDMNEPNFKNTYHYPECRKKMQICNKAIYLPICVAALNIVVGTLLIIFLGGLTMDNYVTMELFGNLIIWSIITIVPSVLVLAGYKAQCIVSCIAYMFMTAFIGNVILMVISFFGALVSIVTLFYLMEREDLSKIEGYPNFIEEDLEYLRPSRKSSDDEKNGNN